MYISELGRPIRIILVEDDEDHAELITRGLTYKDTDLPVQVQVFEDGESVLDYLFRRGEYQSHNSWYRPDLILLDIMLPKLSGIEVLREIKNDTTLQTIPVVMLTTSNHDRDVIASYNNGANSYITKPDDILKFFSTMKLLRSYWACVNFIPRSFSS